MLKIIKKLGINEKFTRPAPKEKVFTKIKDNIPHKQDLNFMMDILILPKTKEGYNSLLVCVDLHSREFDIEPLKNKQPKSVLNAFETMIKRPYLKLPYYSIQTDGGAEFKSEFSKFLYDKSILHKTAQPYRHKQQSMVENLNKQISRILIGYMNKIEEETDKPYNEWTDILNYIRKSLNKSRKIEDGDPYTDKYDIPDYSKKQKFKEGDIVFVKTDYPLNALGNKQPTANFRTGDYRFDRKTPRKIVKVIYMSGKVPYRYILEKKPTVSYTEQELMLADKEKESKYIVEKLIGKKKIKGKTFYLVKWKNYKTKEATYEPEDQLIEDGLQKMIDDFNRAIVAD
jgi:hypothetical protein